MTHRAITFTDNPDNLNLELKKIRDSAIKVDLPDKKVENIIKKRLENSQISQNISEPIESTCNISQSNLKVDSKFVLLPYINKKISSKAKIFFYNLGIKV